MQSTFKTNFLLFSVLMACASNLSIASYQTTPLSCRADNSMNVASLGAVASMRLGQNYEFGEGVSQDDNQAFEWYCNAAMQNNADGQLKIALFLLEGKGNPRDVSTGLAWLNRAANNGSHDAELALGILLVDTDAIRSAVLFKRAAAGGNLYANHRLAELYYYGMGVPQNYLKAQELSELGVAAGFEKSKELLTRIQIKQSSGIFESSQSEPAVESVVQIEPQPPLKVESQQYLPEVSQQDLQEVSQPDLQDKSQEDLQAESHKSSSLLQRFLSILPSLPMTEVTAPSEVTVTTSQAVDVRAPSEVQLSAPDLVSTVISHPVVVEPVVNVPTISVTERSVTNASVPDDTIAVSESRLPEVNKLVLEDQLVAAANNAIEQENEKAPIVAKRIVQKKAKLSSINKSPDSHDYARDAGWINKQPEMRYSIQLLQTTHLDGIFKYIKRHNLDHDAYYIHVLKDGEYRYILLYGKYPNNRTSKQVAKTLPDAVQKAGYWIRTFGDLRRSYVISP